MHERRVTGIIANPIKPNAAALTREVAQKLRAGGAAVLFEEAAAELAHGEDAIPLPRMAEEADVIVVLGGDGTLLRAVRILGGCTKPIAALNTGRLGFLTAATTEETDRFVRAILTGDYQISRRSTITAHFTAEDGRELSQTGLNEAVVARGEVSRMIRVDVRIDGEFLNGYHGDGLIVSTPTGSTAYSLSAGGPIINPQADVFCISPICPHAIANRAFVVNDDAAIELLASGGAGEALLTLDGGNPWPLRKESPVILRRGAWTVPLVMLPGTSFYEVLREKLQWSGSHV